MRSEVRSQLSETGHTEARKKGGFGGERRVPALAVSCEDAARVMMAGGAGSRDLFNFDSTALFAPRLDFDFGSGLA